MDIKRLENKIRTKYPGKGRAADHENSRAAAIWLLCVSCSGGTIKQAKGCGDHVCPVWPYRPGANGKRPPKTVPTADEYRAMSSVTDEQREVAKERLHLLRVKKRGEA